MVGYLCATPFHITAAITMQSGMFAGEPATLIVLNHFDVDEALINRIRQTGVFDEVRLFNSSYKTKKDNLKRLVNAFFPVALMRDVANHTQFSHFICFALDFIDLTYIMQRYEQRGIDCEFAFGDDGIGTYIREGIYRPKAVSTALLTLNGRRQYVERVRRVYAYKPPFMVANTAYDVQPIVQSGAACDGRRRAVRTIWPLQENVDMDGRLLYFEQPSEDGYNEEDLQAEQKLLRLAADTLGVPTAVKMHPRSQDMALWQAFGALRTTIPYEVLLLQQHCAPALLMSISSTAMFSAYLFDDLPAACCPSVMLYKLMKHQEPALTEALEALCDRINADAVTPCIYNPDTVEALQQFLRSLCR